MLTVSGLVPSRWYSSSMGILWSSMSNSCFRSFRSLPCFFPPFAAPSAASFRRYWKEKNKKKMVTHPITSTSRYPSVGCVQKSFFYDTLATPSALRQSSGKVAVVAVLYESARPNYMHINSSDKMKNMQIKSRYTHTQFKGNQANRLTDK